MAAHATLGASSFYRAAACPASLRMSEGMPNESSPSAEKGTRAHAAAEAEIRCVIGGGDGGDVADAEARYAHLLEMLDPSEVESYEQAIQVYVDFVLSNYEDGDLLMLERRVSLEQLNPPVEMFGTSDCILYKPRQRKLIVADAKFGVGYVDHRDNSQAKYYALGALLELPHLDVDVVEAVIVQPRLWNEESAKPRSDFYAPIELRTDFAAEALAVAYATQDPNAPIVAGEHCQFCPAAPRCPAKAERALSLAQDEFGAETALDPRLISEEQAIAILNRLDEFDAFASALRGWAHSKLSRGEPVPGWTLKPKRATRTLNTTEAEFVATMTAAGVDRAKLYAEPKLRTAAQLEKAGLTKEQKATLQTMFTAVSSGFNLVRDDGRGVQLPNASDEFSADL